MKINNKSVQGIYVYDSALEFEKGDFVIFNGCIYVCNPKSNQTTFPVSPDKDLLNFSPYLSTGKLSIEEFDDLYKNGLDRINQEDKLITSDIFCKILKKISFGLDQSGIIDKEILRGFISPEFEEFTNNNNTDIIDQLILNSDKIELNNLSIKVDRKLFEGYLITEKPLDVIIDDEDFKSVILNQYTYTEFSESSEFEYKTTFRIQEVIDHVFGICMYRYSRLDSNNLNKEVSSWKVSCPSVEYVKQFSNYMKTAINKINKERDNNFFNFREINFKRQNLEEDNTYTYELLDDIDLSNKFITITISDSPINSNISTNYSMTVKFINSVEYKFPNDTTVSMSNNVIKLEKSLENKNEVIIVNIYARDYGRN